MHYESPLLAPAMWQDSLPSLSGNSLRLSLGSGPKNRRGRGCGVASKGCLCQGLTAVGRDARVLSGRKTQIGSRTGGMQTQREKLEVALWQDVRVCEKVSLTSHR